MLNNQMYCPVCLGSSSLGGFLGCSKTYTDAIPIELMVSICSDCRSFYLKTYVKEVEIGNYYPKSYFTKNRNIGSDSFGARVRQLSYTIFKGYPRGIALTPVLLMGALVYGIVFWRRLGRFPRYIKQDNKPTALEVGYGAGSYLIDLTSMGWKCFGIDIDQSNSTQMADHGISVGRDFDALNLKKEGIDYIYSYHAFEHIYNIESNFKECFTALSDNGVFKLCVPISDGLLPRLFKKYWYDLGVPIHKQIFSVAGIHILADRHGFKVSKYKCNSYSESFVGSIIACLLGLFDVEKAAQSYIHSRLFKISCLLVSPIVFVLDSIGLGDRAEFVLTKK
jgi:hypothetical protein